MEKWRVLSALRPAVTVTAVRVEMVSAPTGKIREKQHPRLPRLAFALNPGDHG